MSTSEQPATKTASRCPAPQTTARGSHTFIIDGYSLHQRLGARKYIQSAAFDVGGYSWCISYYPDDRDDMALYVTLLTEAAEVRALYDLRLVDQTRGSSCSFLNDIQLFITSFTSIDGERNPSWGSSNKLMKWTELEESPYLRDDRLVIECDITVILKESEALLEASLVHVPPSNMLDDVKKLAEMTVGTDVTFTVDGEAFRAHKIILAARSPIFMAQLYGPPVGEVNSREFVTVENMKPTVFKALLHFIYNDSLPDMEHLDDDDHREMVKHLLAAADWYAIERLKLICEEKLCRIVDAETAEMTLALAEQHSCRDLKEACLRYIINAKRKHNVSARQCYPEPKRIICVQRNVSSGDRLPTAVLE
ncbi:hypothetical protein EJB05_08365, partial [Eragrostis curvula]